jgi:hypothetical protein
MSTATVTRRLNRLAAALQAAAAPEPLDRPLSAPFAAALAMFAASGDVSEAEHAYLAALRQRGAASGG